MSLSLPDRRSRFSSNPPRCDRPRRSRRLNVEFLETRLCPTAASLVAQPQLPLAPTSDHAALVGRLERGREASLIDASRVLGDQHPDHLAWSGTPGAPAEVGVFVDNRNGKLTADELARIDDAIAELNRTWTGTLGVHVSRVTNGDAARIRLTFDSTSGCGGRTQGVLGCAEFSFFADAAGSFPDGHALHRFAGPEAGTQAVVTLIDGWSWYAGQSSLVPAGRLDFQSVVTQELGHVLGLDHDTSTYVDSTTHLPLNGDGRSTMFPSLSPGQAHRSLSARDLADLNHLYAFGSDADSLEIVASSANFGNQHHTDQRPQHDTDAPQAQVIVVVPPHLFDAHSVFATQDSRQTSLLTDPRIEATIGLAVHDTSDAMLTDHQGAATILSTTVGTPKHRAEPFDQTQFEPLTTRDTLSIPAANSPQTNATSSAVPVEPVILGANSAPSARLAAYAQLGEQPTRREIADTLLSGQHWTAYLPANHRGRPQPETGPQTETTISDQPPAVLTPIVAASLALYWGTRLAETDPELRARREFLVDHVLDGE